MPINGYSDVLSTGAQGLVAGGAFSAPSQWWFALYSTTPDSDGTNLDTEFTAASYTRIRIYGSDEAFLPKWSIAGLAGVDFVVSNLQPIYFPAAIEAWGTLNGTVIMNSETLNTASNMILGASVDIPTVVAVGMTIVFLQGTARVTSRNI